MLIALIAHSGDTAHAYGGLHDIHTIYAGDRNLEYCFTPPDKLKSPNTKVLETKKIH